MRMTLVEGVLLCRIIVVPSLVGCTFLRSIYHYGGIGGVLLAALSSPIPRRPWSDLPLFCIIMGALVDGVLLVEL